MAEKKPPPEYPDSFVSGSIESGEFTKESVTYFSNRDLASIQVSGTAHSNLSSGIIRFIDKTKGYGFIEIDQGKSGIFFKTALLIEAPWITADVGTKVAFATVTGKNGPEIFCFGRIAVRITDSKNLTSGPLISTMPNDGIEPSSSDFSTFFSWDRENSKDTIDKTLDIGANIEVISEKEESNPANWDEAKKELENNDNNEQIKRVFEFFSQLPAVEIDRITKSAKRKVAKWEGLPTVAPELYRDRPTSEGLPDFLRRAYGKRKLLDGKFTTAHLDILDPAAAKAVRSWVEHHGNLPTDVKLPVSKNRPKGTKFSR